MAWANLMMAPFSTSRHTGGLSWPMACWRIASVRNVDGEAKPTSRQIQQESKARLDECHRIVYKVEGDALLIAQLRYHY
ncbi:MAG: type II toxin-antitoxin system YoeB family toxin [SAR202 cluster bacterium]|nr:type II toxin-antitoxin system YoeB family toxin [SAR202 cluster bacterium]